MAQEHWSQFLRGQPGSLPGSNRNGYYVLTFTRKVRIHCLPHPLSRLSHGLEMFMDLIVVF